MVFTVLIQGLLVLLYKLADVFQSNRWYHNDVFIVIPLISLVVLVFNQVEVLNFFFLVVFEFGFQLIIACKGS